VLIDTAVMARGTRAAKNSLWMGVAFLAILILLSASSSFAGDPATLLLIWMLTGIAYLLKVGEAQWWWRAAVVAVTPEGFTAPRRSFAAAYRREPGRLVRWEEVHRAALVPAGRGPIFGENHSASIVIGMKTTMGYRIYEENQPEAFPRICERLRDKVEPPGMPAEGMTAGDWVPSSNRRRL
jgi:hypothetical protein